MRLYIIQHVMDRIRRKLFPSSRIEYTIAPWGEMCWLRGDRVIATFAPSALIATDLLFTEPDSLFEDEPYPGVKVKYRTSMPWENETQTNEFQVRDRNDKPLYPGYRIVEARIECKDRINWYTANDRQVHRIHTYYPNFGCRARIIRNREYAIGHLNRKARHPEEYAMYMADIDARWPVTE